MTPGSEWGLARAGQAESQHLLAFPSLRATLICQAAAAVMVVAAAVSKKRARASSWPAVRRGTLSSPCCSLTTTSSAEVTTGEHCLSPPPSFNSSVDRVLREHRLCPWSFHSAQPRSETQECGIHEISESTTTPGPGSSLPVRGWG